MVAYGTYERIDYVTTPLPVWVSWNSGALLLRVLGWVVVAMAALVVGLAAFAGVHWVATALLAYAGQALLGLAITSVFAWATYPR